MLPLFNHSLRLQSNQIKRYLKEYHPFINTGERRENITRASCRLFFFPLVLLLFFARSLLSVCVQTISASSTSDYEFVWGVTTSINIIQVACVCASGSAYKYGYCLFMYFILKRFISVFSPFTFYRYYF